MCMWDLDLHWSLMDLFGFHVTFIIQLHSLIVIVIGFRNVKVGFYITMNKCICLQFKEMFPLNV